MGLFSKSEVVYEGGTDEQREIMKDIATQYALLAGFSLIPRGIFASFSGFISEQVSWEAFWIFSTLLAIPGLLLLFAMRRITFDRDGNPLREKAAPA